MDRKESISFAKALVATKKIDFKIKVVAVKAEALEADLVKACEQLVASDNQKALDKVFKDNAEAKVWWEDQQEEEEEDDAGSEVDPPTEVEYSAETIAAAEVLEIEAEEDESEPDFILRICKKVDSLDDEGWDALGEVTQDWTNARNEETKQAKKKAAETGKKKTAAADKKDGKKAATKASGTTKTATKDGSKSIHSEKVNPEGKMWKESSSAGRCLQLLVEAGKKGITVAKAIETAEAAEWFTDTMDEKIKHRIGHIFKCAVIRKIASEEEDKFTFLKDNVKS